MNNVDSFSSETTLDNPAPLPIFFVRNLFLCGIFQRGLASLFLFHIYYEVCPSWTGPASVKLPYFINEARPRW